MEISEERYSSIVLALATAWVESHNAKVCYEEIHPTEPSNDATDDEREQYRQASLAKRVRYEALIVKRAIYEGMATILVVAGMMDAERDARRLVDRLQKL